MDSPTSFRKPPRQKERLLDPEVAKAQNEALSRQIERAESASLRYQHMRQGGTVDLHRHGGSLPWRYFLPVAVGFGIVFLGPRLGMPMGRALLIGVLSGLILVAFVFAQDVYRWLSK